ncbi:type IV pilus twitching motility protein PilT [Facilibium subflavum]|uniref:type IV pilus twitching motility protein PilT n=1 Tax=Facilibium subflavum TaxID=2219058 RepID=UPI0013C37374|nr:ATPase, T2SS/T4P/T4SS family [Facilibium subflavum]
MTELLHYGCKNGISDLCLQSHKPLYIKKQGQLHTVAERALTQHEMKAICQHLYGANVEAELARKGELDFRFQSDIATHVVRVNITSAFGSYLDGLQISIRLNQSKPLSLADLAVKAPLCEYMKQGRGLYLISGPTGGGKTTLQAAMIQDRCKESVHGLKVLTYEAPIEYSFDGLSLNNSLICQSEIPKNLPTYAAAVRNALRRNPDLIMIGETRDRETLTSVLEAAYTGHDVITTIHASGVVDVFRRALNYYQQSERDLVYSDMVQALQLIVWQNLVIGVDGKLIALREYLHFDDQMKQKLLTLSYRDGCGYLQKMIKEKGCDLYTQALEAYRNNSIAKATLESLAGITLSLSGDDIKELAAKQKDDPSMLLFQARKESQTSSHMKNKGEVHA